MTRTAPLWPAVDGPGSLAEIEAVPLAERRLPASTYAIVARAAAEWPDAPATSFLPDAERWEQPSVRTFEQLAADVHAVAHVLHGLGVRRRDAVALLSVNCEALHTAVLAAEAVGVAAPLNPALAAGHAAALLQRSGARVLLAAGPELDADGWATARGLAAGAGIDALLALRPTGAAGAAPALEPLEGVRVAHLDDLVGEADGLPCPPPGAGDVASYLHTGGTTGAPKLAVRTHGNEVVNAWQIAGAIEPEPGHAFFAALPLFHANALLVTLLAPLLRGQHVVWAGPLGYRDLPLYGVFWRLVERYRVAGMSGVPTVYAVLAQVPVDADIASLRFPIVGAAPLPPSVAAGFAAHTGAELLEGYGLTEATCATTRNLPGHNRPGSVGQRLPYQAVRAVDPDGAALAPGEAGTLEIRGPVTFLGYLGEDGAPDPGAKLRDGWLDTGDLGTVDADGYVTLTGRVKDLIIRGGHNIDPAVVEDALLEHPDVTAAAAVGAPDEHAGEVPVAYVTVAPGSAPDPEDLREWARGRVAEPAAAPRFVEIIDAIPLTSIGKPYKPELRQRAAARRGETHA